MGLGTCQLVHYSGKFIIIDHLITGKVTCLEFAHNGRNGIVGFEPMHFHTNQCRV
nr:MAG TPA: hypothetical protein [Caudoviricetes sp.]